MKTALHYQLHFAFAHMVSFFHSYHHHSRWIYLWLSKEYVYFNPLNTHLLRHWQNWKQSILKFHLHQGFLWHTCIN